MLAFGLVIVLFSFWLVIGYATIAVLPNRSNLIQNVLLAPAVGLALTLGLVFSLNRLGLPVGSFGPALALILLFGALAILRWQRPVFPWRRYGPFALVFLLALFLSGRPLLEFGFNWLAYSSDDMANYALGAQRFFYNGYASLPDLNDLIAGRDYSLYYWIFHVAFGVRPGSEMLLAWVSSVTGLSTPEVFMSLILAFQLILTSATGALVCQGRKWRGAALATCLLLSLSALTTLGTIYQLIGQVSGLALVTAAATVLLRPYRWIGWRTNLRTATLPGLMLGAQLIIYPEVLPFLILALGLYLLLGFLQKRQTWRDLFPIFGMMGLVVLLLINTYLPYSIRFLLAQTTTSAGGERGSLFPYFLLPSGLANLWGFQNLTVLIGDPWLSLSILGGGLLLALAVFLAAQGSWQRQPVALLCSVMLLVTAYMVYVHNDFGLFKLAMYIQPFLLGVLAVNWANFRFKSINFKQVRGFDFKQVRGFDFKRVKGFGFSRRLAGPALLVLIGVFGSLTQFTYVEAGRGVAGNTTPLIANPSSTAILSEFRQILAKTGPQAVVLDDHNLPLTKLQTVYTRGLETSLFRQVFAGIMSTEMPKQSFDFNKDTQEKAQSLIAEIDKGVEKGTFNLLDPTDPALKTGFTLVGPQKLQGNKTYLISLTGNQSIFNRWGEKPTGQNFEVAPLDAVQNHLIFVFSDLGQNFYLGVPGKIAFYQLEKDPVYPGQTMVGMGRYFVFEAVNPAPASRLVLNMTSTYKGDGENQLPPAQAIGATRQAFPIVGRGSARIFSPVLSPQMINNQPFYGLDMGQDGSFFPFKRTGLMNLYGKDLIVDQRQTVGFGRDVSLVSEEQYRKMAAPSQVSNFPADLANPNLEYSGVFEDGWVSEAAFFGLNQPAGPTSLVLRGMVPQIADPGFTTELTVLVDGQEVDRRTLGLGNFEVKLPAPGPPGRHRVDLRFSNFQRLPGADKRPVGGLLQSVGFVAGPN